MISRHITIQPDNDDYRRLTNYIADAGHQGEKALMSWCARYWSDEDEYQLAIHKVEAVQAMNTRSVKEKTYHLVISFRPEDEARLPQEVFKEIEQEFAKALGFEEHQRHAGVHRNTANLISISRGIRFTRSVLPDMSPFTTLPFVTNSADSWSGVMD